MKQAMSLYPHLLLLVATAIASTCANELARGWGDSIAWTDLETGYDQAKAQNKPLMLVIHKTWCGACKRLKPQFETSKEIAELSEKFIMVNTQDDEEPKGQQFAPDGGYVPRIFFLNPAGDVMADHYNEKGSAQYKYFYHASEQIVGAMNKVLHSQKVAKQEL